jgi:hypothetical protein
LQERKPCAIPTAHGFARNKLLFALFLRILLASTKVDDWVLDPFAGTGTTLVVAEQLQLFRFYTTLLRKLAKSPKDAVGKSLDELAGVCGDFAYIGSRRTLRMIVREQASKLQKKLQQVDQRFWQQVIETQPQLLQRLQRCKDSSSLEEVAAAWFGRRDWAKDSGVFPDFVLALDDASTFGNGSILELKDSDGSSIASFNSTIPTRFKSLIEVKEITGSRMVLEAAWLRDFPHSLASGYEDCPRRCFYLVRTHSRSSDNVRISLIEGSFF